MKLHIPEPCHENWDGMTPNEQGAFCLSCQKNVIDFSTKTIGEIKSFFQKLPETEHVCGRFEKQQLKELSFDDFYRKFRRWNFLHKAAVICFFIFGLSLFSCSPANRVPMVMGEPSTEYVNQLPVDTPRKELPAISPPDTFIITKPNHIKGDVAIEPVKFLQGDVFIDVPDTTQKTNCAPKDTIRNMPEHIMGKPARPK